MKLKPNALHVVLSAFLKATDNVNVQSVIKSTLFRLITNANIQDVIKSRMFYTVHFESEIDSELLCKFFKHLPNNVEEHLYTDDIEFKSNLYAFKTYKSFLDMIIYKGTPIIFSSETMSNEMRTGVVSRPFTKFTTLRNKKDINILKHFITMLVKETQKTRIEYWGKSLQLITSNERIKRIGINGTIQRTFDDVFISQTDKMTITNAIDNFISKREWYNKHHIPYHFGILLYGAPGSGKSSISQAIANYINAEQYIMSGDNLCNLPERIMSGDIRKPNKPNLFNAIIIEDIDCGFSALDRKRTSQQMNGENEIGLGTILNCLDGVMAPSNTIYIFTTNHIENLDPALIRPGRIDLKIEINGITKETFNKFCKHHYDKEPNVEVNESLTFAQIQLKVMEGCSLDEVVEFATSK